MSFHLQLYPPRLLDWTIVLLVLFLPAALTACLLHSVIWIVGVPVAIILLIFCLASAFPRKREVTAVQFANELERHLLGIEGKWDWDDVTSVALADDRLERIRWELPRFDSLTQEKDKEDLRVLIEALRRGEIPDIVPAKDLTYRTR